MSDTKNNNNNKNSYIPLAPYPPLVSTTSSKQQNQHSTIKTTKSIPSISSSTTTTITASPFDKRDRSRSITNPLSTSFGPTTTISSSSSSGLGGTTNHYNTTTSSSSISGNINNSIHNNNINNNTNTPSSSSTTSTTNTPTAITNKRHHPARVEFYNHDLYGAVNCVGHTKTKKLSLPRQTSNATVTTGNSSSLSLSGRMNKLGPVLLELRCLLENSNGDDDSDDDYDNTIDEEQEEDQEASSTTRTRNSNHHQSTNKSTFSYYQGRTIALSRGIASSSFTTSTCLSFRNNVNVNNNHNYVEEVNNTVHCATGLSSGALAIHTFKNIDKYVQRCKEKLEEDNQDNEDNNNHHHQEEKNNYHILDSAKSDDAKVTYLSHHQTRLHRAASAVAWKNSGPYSNHVAIGYSSSSGERDRPSTGQRSSNQVRPGSDGNPGGFAFVWDVEAQSTVSKGVKQTPLHKLAHNSSVSSLSWIPDGQTLAIGCQHRNLQIHDLGISGTSVISVYAHDNSVNGIEVDPHKTNVFATFSRGLAEPVKLWDVRKMDSCLAEIKTHASNTSSSGRIGKELPSFVSAIAWDTSTEGILSIATGGDLKFYNTRLNLSRPVLSHVSHSDGPLQCMKFLPSVTKSNKTQPLIPQRVLAVYTDGVVTDLPTQQIAPVALSNRDGRVVSALGSNLCCGSTIEGPSAMEKLAYDPSEDISATMMRRARCLHMKRYSTDAASNLEMLSLEQDAFLRAQEGNAESKVTGTHLTSLEHLHLVWSWIERVENICFRSSIVSTIDERFWPVKNLCDAGVLHLLRLDVANIDEVTTFDSFSKSEVFNRNVYDSPLRRYVIIILFL
jgi:hypothetical protein